MLNGSWPDDKKPTSRRRMRQPVGFFMRGRILTLICLIPAIFAGSTGHASDWLYYGGTQGGTHHSPLKQITRENVGDLELAWSYRTGALKRHPEIQPAGAASFHGTPILLPEAA